MTGVSIVRLDEKLEGSNATVLSSPPWFILILGGKERAAWELCINTNVDWIARHSTVLISATGARGATVEGVH